LARKDHVIVEVDQQLDDVFPSYLRNHEEDMMKIQTALEKKDFEFLRRVVISSRLMLPAMDFLDWGKWRWIWNVRPRAARMISVVSSSSK